MEDQDNGIIKKIMMKKDHKDSEGQWKPVQVL